MTNPNETTKVADLNDIDVLRQKALVDIPAAVDRLVIANDEDAAAASRIIQGINTVIRKIEDFFSPSKKAAHEAWKAVCANEATLKAQPMSSRDIAQSKLNAYLLERRRRQEAAEREARERAEAEARERERAEAERVRIEAEKEVQEKRLAEAARLEADGKKDEAKVMFEAAAMIEDHPAEAPAPVPLSRPAAPLPPPPPVKFNGVAERKKWYAEVVDFAALPDEYKLPNMAMLNAVAVSKKDTAAVPGVKFTWRIESAVGRIR